MKQKLQTLTIIILAALLVNSFLYAEEKSAGNEIRGNAEEGISGTGILQGSVSGGDARPEEGAQGSVSGGDARPEEGAQGSVSGNDARPEEGAQESVSGDEVRPEEGAQESVSEDEARPEEGAQESMSGDAVGEGDASQEKGSEDLTEAEGHKAAVFSVSVPKSMDFVLDPYELSGQGSVWSQEYSFANKGNTPIRLSLRDLCCTAAEDVLIVESEESIKDGEKTALLWLSANHGGILEITEKNSVYEIILQPEEEFIFQVKGKISVSDRWRSEDIRLSMRYQIETVDVEE